MAKTRKPQDTKTKELLKVGGETFPGGIGELRLRCKDLCLVAPQGLSKKEHLDGDELLPGGNICCLQATTSEP